MTREAGLPPVVDDLSIYLLAGRMKHVPGKGWETPGGVFTEQVPVKAEVTEAERLGFRRAWISERYNVKDAAPLLGGAAAVTERIGLATGAVATSARPPIVNASFGATMNAAYGPRFVLGLGRGDRQLYTGHGFRDDGEVSFQHLIDHADIVRRLWRGETIDYDGPAGSYHNLVMVDRPEVPPEIWFVHLGGPKAAKVAANPVFDGAVLPDLLSYEGTEQSVAWTREECERIGRDPASLRICQCVVTAPDMDDTATREMVHARAVLIMGYKAVGDMYTKMNGWDPKVTEEVRAYQQGTDGGLVLDLKFHRSGMLGLTELVPDEWMRKAAAIGSVDECVETLQRFKDAGADEIAVYGSTPTQNAKLIAAWAARDQR